MSSPPHFFEKIRGWIFWSGFIGMALLSIGLIWGLGIAPADYQQGNSFRIIYIHVPAASAAMSAYVLLAIWGVIFLVWKIKMVDILAQSLVPVGTVLCAIALLTGSLWGIPTWGTAWAADARILSMALLLFLYIGLFLIRTQLKPLARAQRIASIVALVGVINIPVIKYSVEWVSTLHQGATFTLTEKPKMPPEMYLPLIFTLFGVYFLLFAWTMIQARWLCLQRESGKQWVNNWLQQEKDEVNSDTQRAGHREKE
jgi:heme exporter protein C